MEGLRAGKNSRPLGTIASNRVKQIPWLGLGVIGVRINSFVLLRFLPDCI